MAVEKEEVRASSHAALDEEILVSVKHSDGNLERLRERDDPIKVGIRWVEGLRTGGGKNGLELRDLFRDYRREGVEIGIVLGDGSTVGGGLGEGGVVGGIRGGARGLSMQGFHGHEVGHWGLGNVADLFRHPGGWGLGHGILREAGALQNDLTQLGDSDPLTGVTLEDAAQDTDHLGGERQNTLQEERVLEVGLECGVLDRCPLPWVAATGEVD